MADGRRSVGFNGSPAHTDHRHSQWRYFCGELIADGAIDDDSLLSYQDVPFTEVVCPGPMGHDHPSHNDGSIPSPITPTAFSSRVGNPVFHHPSEPSSSQVPIDDYDERFGMGLESFVDPGSLYTGAALSQPYTWSPPFTWVDGFAPANQEHYNTGPEPSAGNNGFPIGRHGSPGNHRVGGHPSADASFTAPWCSESPPTFSPNPKGKARECAKGLLASSPYTHKKAGRPKPLKSASRPPAPFPSSSSQHLSVVKRTPAPCPYGPKLCSPRACSLKTFLRQPFQHWMVHMLDELAAIRMLRPTFQNHWVINTEVKYWMAEKYHTNFCPNCHNTFLGQNQVINHLMYSPECSQCVPCHCCAPGDQLKCEHCVRHFIIRSYLELAGEIGFVPPNGRSLYHNPNWRAVKEDLTAREWLCDQSRHFSNC